MDPSNTASVPGGGRVEDSGRIAKENWEKLNKYRNSRPERFRFKKGSLSAFKSSPHDDGHDRHNHQHRRHGRHHHHCSSKRQKTSESPSRAFSFENPPLSPNTAFRESLFDALGDDEGAAFWETVYGQPIHTYAAPSVPKGPNGELERMSDDEYAAYVRARMWEKTHEGIMEERDRCRKERARQKERADRRQREAEEKLRFERALEESLKRGNERKRTKAWVAAWGKYQRSWEDLNSLIAMTESGTGGDDRPQKPSPLPLRNHIFWPVESGKQRDVSLKAVEEFIRHAPPPLAPNGQSKDQNFPSHLLTTLKTERVRWHPDKIQHRYGALGIDESVTRSVTEVFQILDRLWSEERDTQKRKQE